jgi:hypothetical protein
MRAWRGIERSVSMAAPSSPSLPEELLLPINSWLLPLRVDLLSRSREAMSEKTRRERVKLFWVHSSSSRRRRRRRRRKNWIHSLEEEEEEEEE